MIVRPVENLGLYLGLKGGVRVELDGVRVVGPKIYLGQHYRHSTLL